MKHAFLSADHLLLGLFVVLFFSSCLFLLKMLKRCKDTKHAISHLPFYNNPEKLFFLHKWSKPKHVFFNKKKKNGEMYFFFFPLLPWKLRDLQILAKLSKSSQIALPKLLFPYTKSLTDSTAFIFSFISSKNKPHHKICNTRNTIAKLTVCSVLE